MCAIRRLKTIDFANLIKFESNFYIEFTWFAWLLQIWPQIQKFTWLVLEWPKYVLFIVYLFIFISFEIVFNVKFERGKKTAGFRVSLETGLRFLFQVYSFWYGRSVQSNILFANYQTKREKEMEKFTIKLKNKIWWVLNW